MPAPPADEGNSILRNEIQAQWNEFQIRRNEVQSTFLRRIEPFQGLTLTPTSICNPSLSVRRRGFG